MALKNSLNKSSLDRNDGATPASSGGLNSVKNKRLSQQLKYTTLTNVRKGKTPPIYSPSDLTKTLKDSTLDRNDGTTPESYIPSNLVNKLGNTSLDRNDGATPSSYSPQSLSNSLNKTSLDRNDGATPSKYLDNLPK